MQNQQISSIRYLWKCYVGDDDNVEGRRSVLLDAGVTTWVVLVRAGAAHLPGLAVLGLGHGALGGSASGGASCRG